MVPLPSQLQAGKFPAWLIREVWLARGDILFISFWLGHPDKSGHVLLYLAHPSDSN